VKFVFSEDGFADYVHWQDNDRRMLERVNQLLRDIARGAEAGRPNEGIGKPEALKHGLHGYWSRRVSDEHRLVHKVVDDEIRIAQCRYHYES
jgi:toxin YoeB